MHTLNIATFYNYFFSRVQLVLTLKRVEGASSATRQIGLKNYIKNVGKEVTLIVRFQNVGASNTKRKRRHTSNTQNLIISIDCKKVFEESLSPPFFGKSNAFPLSGGYLTVGMSYDKDGKAQNVFQVSFVVMMISWQG